MEAVEVDGSYGEGGGQILRTAVAFSIVLDRPLHVFSVRAGRERPGLRPQHAASLALLAKVSGGKIVGADVGSNEVWFEPGRKSEPALTVDMGTAASVTLALQAAVPAVALSGRRLSLGLVGGTDVPWSPTYDYLVSVIKPGLQALGIVFSARADARGYYPRGGGRVSASIEPSSGVKAVRWEGRKGQGAAHITSRCARLPRSVAERQASAAHEVLVREGVESSGSVVTEETAASPGTSILISHESEGCVFGADGIGARGRRAEEVGAEAATLFASEWRTRASVDSRLADMLAPLLSLAETESRLLIPRATDHLKTGLHVAELFTGCTHELEPEGGGVLLTVRPGGRRAA